MSKVCEEIKKRIESLAKDADESVEDIMNVFEAVKFTIKSKMPYLPEVRLDNQTISALENHYNKKNRKKPQRQIFIPFGVFSDPKDQNKVLRDAINKEWSEPQNHQKMIDDGKVFTMKVGEEVIDGETVDINVAISGNHPYKTELVNKVKVVTEATPWKPGDKIIPRNYQEQIKYGKELYDNWNYGNELNPSWKVSLFGIGYFDGTKEVKTKDEETGAVIKKQVNKNMINDGTVCRIDFTGDLANPYGPKFIVKQPIWFNLTFAKTFDQKFSNELFLQSRAKQDTGLEIIPSDVLRLLDYEDEKGNLRKGIITIINDRISMTSRKLHQYINSGDLLQEPKEIKEKIMGLFKLYSKYVDVDFIPVIDLNGVDNYHKSHKALRDPETLDIIKDGAWDKTDFNSFAISECSYTGMYAPQGKPPKMVITDPSLPQNKSLFCKYPNGIDPKMPEGQALVSIMTSRGNQAYDEESGEYVEDPENAVAIPKVKGIKILCKYDDIDVEKILADL